MKRKTVKSSNVQAIGYNKEKHILEVEFKSGGVYQYADVLPDVYEELMAATSIGGYLHEHIVRAYVYTKLK